MNPTDEAVAKADAKLDEAIKQDPKEDKQPVKEEPKDDKKEAKDVDKTTDSDKKEQKTDEKVEEKTTDKEDTGYTADELEAGDEDEEKSKESTDSGKADDTSTSTAPSGLTGQNKYVYENLPEIVTYDKAGNEVKLKTYQELPASFEFLDKRTEMAFIANMNAQELNARDLIRQYQEQESGKSAAEFEERENVGIKQDIAELQKAGELPKFKKMPDEDGFEKDPATEEAQKVLDYMNERNAQYLKEYEQGRPYRHIGFREAFYMYKRANPGEIKSREEHQEDKERKEVAEKLKLNVGLSSDEIKKPVVRSGTTTRDILNRIDNME